MALCKTAHSEVIVKKVCVLAVFSLLILWLTGCTLPGTRAATAPVVTIVLSPSSASVQAGQTQQFTATVSGTTSTAVTWSATGGTVLATGLYTAPAAAGTYTVTATSAADTTKSASAMVTVSAAPVVSVTISPNSAAMLTNGTQQFTATVSGTSNSSVTWSATGGSISSTGLYSAPGTAGTYTVKATSVADSSKSASATVVVAAVGVSLSPASVSLPPGGTQQFTATVSGSANTAVTWSATGGSVSSTGLYTAPGTPGNYTVKATSVADTSKSASAAVTVSTTPVVSIMISPTSASLLTGSMQQFSATVSGSANTAVTWSATGGSVSSTGLYTAPGTPGNYTVKATSVADTSKSASAAVTVSTTPVVSVTISPTAASLLTGGTQQFTATVSGASNTGVTWSATGGSITSGGLYTAGQTVGTYAVTATSVADSTKSASSTVTITTTTAACSGTCYYVSPTGSDSNPGTSTGAPWRTIAQVQGFQSNLKPGDSVLFQRGGVWYEELDITNINGSSGSPITIGNYGTGDLPVIDGGQTNSTQGRNYCIDAINTAFQWITVDGIECRNAYRQGITFQAYSGTGINGVGIVVKNSYIHHDGAAACTTCGSTPASDPGGYVNQLDAQRLTGVQFLNNTLDHCGGHNCLQVHYDNGSAIVSGNAVGTNAPWCNHNCIDVKGGMGTQVTNNVVTCPSCATSTAAFYTENTGYAGQGSETITYTGNTAYTVPIGFQAETGGSCSSSSCSIDAKYYNNTIYNTNSSWFNFMDTSCSSHTLDMQKNIVDGGQADIHSNCTTTWDYNDAGGLYSISGNPSGPHDLKLVNPQYVNATAGNFTPQNTTILTYGTNDAVTPFAYLGAAH